MKHLLNRSTLLIMAIAVLFSCLFWIGDSIYEYCMFTENLRYIIFEQPLTFLDALLYRIPNASMFGRIAFIIACLIGGILVSSYYAFLKQRQEQLRKSEEKYRTLIESLPHQIFQKDINFIYTSSNINFARELGVEPNEIVGKTDDDFYTSDIAKKHREQDMLVVKEQRPVEFEECTTRDGITRYWSVQKIPIRNDNGIITGILGICHDITDRKFAELALKESEERYRAYVNNAPDGIIVCDRNSLVQEANSAACQILHQESEEIIGMSFAQVFQRTQFDKSFEYMNEHKEAGIVSRECTIRVSSGAQKWVDVSSVLLADNRILSFIRDITAKKSGEEELIKLATTISQTSESILITDQNGTIGYVNPAFEKNTGYSREEVIGKNPRILKSGKNPPEVYRELWSRILSGNNWTGRLVNRRKDGVTLIEDITITPIRNAEGEITDFISVRYNRTKEMELEEQLRQSQKIESIGQLAGGIAHDFNNLLSPILSYAEMLMEEFPASSPPHQHSSKIFSAGNQAKELIRQLLAFSRKQDLVTSVHNLDEIVRENESILRRLVRENIELVFELKASDQRIKADSSQISQIIINLAVNASDAMPNGGRMIIETRNFAVDEKFTASHFDIEPGDYIVMSVSDTGTGMDNETVRRIFEPFFTTKEIGKGTGLGLSTVHGIAKQHNGSISVYSEVGKGTTFRIYLPVCRDDDVKQPEQQRNIPIQGTETVLVCEDDITVRQLVQDILDSQGYSVVAASDPKHALQLLTARKNDIRLLVTDVVMPHMNGEELYAKACEIKPHIKVLFMSGYTDEFLSGLNSRKAGVNLIQKPFTMTDFAERVRKTLDT